MFFDTPISTDRDNPAVLGGPLRKPRNLLTAQTYGQHASIHDDETAQRLGFQGGTVEGPTHFSQFAPLGAALWGCAWFEHGCVSVHFRAPAYDGEEVQAFVDSSTAAERWAHIWMTKGDGTEVLTGTMSIGPKHPVTALDQRLAALRAPSGSLSVLQDVRMGERTERQRVRLSTDQAMGDLYPFSLAEKLCVITEPSPIYLAEAGNPFGRATMPMEMISVLAQYRAVDTFRVRPGTIGLFADLEIKLLSGPLFPDTDYELDREVQAVSTSRRTESVWIRSCFYEPGAASPLATVLLNSAFLTDDAGG